ncbi:hypothetical protein SDC9_136583 [bioreactor metagenome]|uniref:IPTL-CTERM protein sorting domain-containing protein n=1 Tax=bioreactor metagenome TaxID=1076179 RepID=A0A645DJ33_9ZZZZ
MTIRAPLVDMQASAPTSVTGTTGQPVTVTSTCTNAGPDTAEAATCSVSGAPVGATTICTPTPPIAALAAGAAITCETRFTPTSTAAITLTTTAGSITADTDPTNDAAPTSVSINSTPQHSDPHAVPTLGEWAMLLMSLMLAGLGAWRVRKG